MREIILTTIVLFTFSASSNELCNEIIEYKAKVREINRLYQEAGINQSVEENLTYETIQFYNNNCIEDSHESICDVARRLHRTEVELRSQQTMAGLVLEESEDEFSERISQIIPPDCN